MLPHRGSSIIALLIALAIATSTSAQQPPPADLPALDPAFAEPKPDRLTDLMNRVTNLESELKKSKEKEQVRAAKPTINWTMQLQIDDIFSRQDAANQKAVGVAPDGAAFRRARIGMYGDYGPWEYRIAMDFAQSGRPSFIDNYIGLNDIPIVGHVRVGHFFEPIGLEQYSQNRFVTFLERSMTSEVLGPPRNLGILAFNTYANERGTWALGMFRTDSDVYGDDSGTQFQSAGTGRITWLPWYDDETNGRDMLHVGVSYSARAAKNEQVRFRARPEIRIGSTDPNIPFFADTGVIPTNFYQILSAETMLVHGPFSAQAEYLLLPVSTYTNGVAYFQAWYAMGSVFLTGEHRAYRKRTGTLERIVPLRDFVKRDGGGISIGPGAWEIASRVSYLDLNSAGITGGRLTDITIGVNWYLTPYARVTANYIKALSSPAKGEKGTADFFGIRSGYEF